MKRFVRFFSLCTLLLLIGCTAFSLVACSDSLEGTYIYDDKYYCEIKTENNETRLYWRTWNSVDKRVQSYNSDAISKNQCKSDNSLLEGGDSGTLHLITMSFEKVENGVIKITENAPYFSKEMTGYLIPTSMSYGAWLAEQMG